MTDKHKIGAKGYTISSSGLTVFYCPAEIVKVTPKQFVARLPNGLEKRYRREGNREIGGLGGSYFRFDGPPEGPGYKLSAAAQGQTDWGEATATQGK